MTDPKALAAILRDDERARVRNTLPMGIDETIVDRIASKMPAWQAADYLDRLSAPEGVGLTRYDLVGFTMETADDGEWVSHEDAAAVIAAKEAEKMAAARGWEDQCDKAHADYLALRAERDALKAALALAATRLEILTGRMRACHEETGKHELLDEAEAFCTETRAALSKTQGGE